MNAGLFVNDSIHEFFALRGTLFDDPNTAAIIHHLERGLGERSPGPELSID